MLDSGTFYKYIRCRMRLEEKIQQIRTQKQLKLVTVQANIEKIFGQKAISRRTLMRLVGGEPVKKTALYQLCVGLGITYPELIKDTDAEFPVAELIKRNDRHGRYYYDKSAYGEVVNNPNEPFLILLYVLKPGGKTKAESDPRGQIKYRKALFVTMGALSCKIKGKNYNLKKGDCLTFDSSTEHVFENHSPRESQALLIQHPPRL